MAEKITVIDSIMGTGKTSWAIQYMNEHPEQSFVYCTPFLDEVDRVKDTSGRNFYDPKRIDGRKIEGFNYLLMEGRDICVTHSTFSNSNSETLEHIANGNYCLILDEVLDILVDFNSIATKGISKGDIRLLKSEGFITEDEYGKVKWLKNSYPDSKYADVERLAKQGHLFYLDESLLVWQFPPEIFSAFKEIYVLTYLFNGSFLAPYFQYHHLQYDLASVTKDVNGKYRIVPHSEHRREKATIKSLLQIHNDRSANDYKNSSLSKSWFLKASPKKLEELQKHIYNYFRNVTKAKSSEILWTCPKDFQKLLKGKGYNVTRKMTAEEKKLSQEEIHKLEKQLSCYIPCNARATNVYRDRTTLVYAINMFSNPYVSRYFQNKNDKDGTDIHVDEDYLALGCMLQWIWRSCIRDNKPVRIYIPSTRMRTLLINWLDGKM